MEYKYIKKFLPELKTIHTASDYGNNVRVVSLNHLEAELAKGVEVFGNAEEIDNATFTTTEVECEDTHSGLLLNYKPLESSKPVSREELLNMLKSCDTFIDVPDNFDSVKKDLANLISRLEKNGVK